MSTIGSTKAKILTPGKHFLYLPLYYAASKSFFGYIPDSYELTIEDGSTSVTDLSVLNSVLDDTTFERAACMFALCDPMPALQVRFAKANVGQAIRDSNLAIVGGLVTTTTFWAIDHDANVTSLRDFNKFDVMFGYGQGSTAYQIGRRVLRNNRSTKYVEKGMHADLVTSLLDHLDTGVGKAVALTASPLEAATFAANDPDQRIVFDLGAHPEFANTLLTALMTRKDVCNEHPDLVRGLAKALIRATMMVVAADEEVLEYARGRFRSHAVRSGQNNLQDVHDIKLAIDMANMSDAYSPTLTIPQSCWKNAIRLAFSQHDRLSPADEHKASESYAALVAPYRGICRSAAADLNPGPIAPILAAPDSRRLFSYSYVLTIGLLMGTLAADPKPDWWRVVSGLFVVIGGLVLLVKLRLNWIANLLIFGVAAIAASALFWNASDSIWYALLGIPLTLGAQYAGRSP